jgi:hypothetical protein
MFLLKCVICQYAGASQVESHVSNLNLSGISRPPKGIASPFR